MILEQENYFKLGIDKAKVITAMGMFYDMEDQINLLMMPRKFYLKMGSL